MRVAIVTPAPPGSRSGNRVTALRWARILRSLGHSVVVRKEYTGGSFDLLIALHARRSYPSVERFRRLRSGIPIVVGLAGTDLYVDLPRSGRALRSLKWATRVILLQPLARLSLPRSVRPKARVIYQSVAPLAARSGRRSPGAGSPGFQVCVLGHLRSVKDPFRAALAVRLLPPSSSIRIVHVGGALSDGMRRRAEKETARSDRYRWLGERPRNEARRILAGCRVLLMTSIVEGGANAISEALAESLPVLSSRIPGAVGILGASYTGYFPAGDERALASLLLRTETDAAFYEELRRRCRRAAALVSPSRERRCWQRLLQELHSESRRSPGGHRGLERPPARTR